MWLGQLLGRARGEKSWTSAVGHQAERGEWATGKERGRGFGVFGQHREGEVLLLFFFYILFYQAIFKSNLKSNLNSVLGFGQKPLISRIKCTSMIYTQLLLSLMINFILKKSIIFTIFS